MNLSLPEQVKALFIFHCHTGARIAARSSIPIFAIIAAGIISSPDPAGTVTSIALKIFTPRQSFIGLLFAGCFAFLLSLQAAPRLSAGMAGWIRHLGFSGRANKYGLLLALAIVQFPLWIALGMLGIIAYTQGCKVYLVLPHMGLLLAAAIYAAFPSRRRIVTAGLSAAAAICALSGKPLAIVSGVLLLVFADFLTETVREKTTRKPWNPAGSFFEWKIAWRALGFQLAGAYAPALPALGATALFVYNNDLKGTLPAAVCRFGGGIASAAFILYAAGILARLRPPWPWARSFPVASWKRVASDALFLGLYAAPLLIPVALINLSSVWFILPALPLLSIRAAGRMREIRKRNSDVRDNIVRDVWSFLECFGIAALTALLPVASIAFMIAAVPAFVAARNADTRQKVSLWQELHYLATGDTINWSDQ